MTCLVLEYVRTVLQYELLMGTYIQYILSVLQYHTRTEPTRSLYVRIAVLGKPVVSGLVVVII